MSLINCPECGKRVSDRASACPHCGFPVEGLDFSDKGVEKGNNYIKWAWICIIVFIIFLVWLLSREDTSSIAYKSTDYTGYKKSWQEEREEEKREEYAKRKRDLLITVSGIEKNHSSVICKGTIKNLGDESYKFVEVKGSFMDEDGNVIDTGDTYGIGSEGLSPGESTTFKIYCDYNRKITQCSVSIVND